MCFDLVRKLSESSLNAHQHEFIDSAKERHRQIQNSNRLVSLARSSLRRIAVVDHDWVLRRLIHTEIKTLCGPCRCTSTDWSQIRLLLPTNQQSVDQSHLLEQLVSDNAFADTVVLGIDANALKSSRFLALAGDYANLLPIGIKSNGIISNCILEANTHVSRNSVLSQTHVYSNSAISNCGVVSCRGTLVTDKLKLVVGAESGGGRQLCLMPESTMLDVCQQLGASRTPPRQQQQQQQQQQNQQQVTANTPSCERNIISSYCVVRDTPTVQNVLLGSNCSVVGATSVSQAVLFPNASIENASSVRNVVLQWDASVLDHSTISNTFLMEQAHAGPNSLVVSTVLGPDVHVSAGEVHASVVGPNTNAHHQSLVIGVLWPLGRGNVGYGANVGSNHTGRIPDQETCAGEGTFWGLSCVIKFPVDLSLSPYSIVAAGTNLPPQRITMPFSLIVAGSDGINNEIIPGWVLQSSPYTILRSEDKYATRRKAQRHAFYTGWKIIRPDTIELCRAARQALEVETIKPAYQTDRDVLGIGQNHLSERGRQGGIQAYTGCIQRYSLSGFLLWMEEQIKLGRDIKEALEREFSLLNLERPTINLKVVTWPTFPWESKDEDDVDDDTLSHQLKVLREEFPVSGDVIDWAIHVLHSHVQSEHDFAKNVYKCKKRDDVRGSSTIPGYCDFHIAAEKDAVILGAQEEAASIERRARTILDLLASTQRSRL